VNARTAEAIIPVERISFRVLGREPDPERTRHAAGAVRSYLQRKRPALAGALDVRPGPGGVRLCATGMAPEQMLAEVKDLIVEEPLRPVGEIDVDPEEFIIELGGLAAGYAWDAPILHSRVRSFPYPECEWYDVTSGLLTLTPRQLSYEPEMVILGDAAAEPGGRIDVPLDGLVAAGRAEWWDVPCLLVETARQTHRFGWPAERGDPALEFDVEEWLAQLRKISGGRP
jgi:hypothetical protein